MRVIFPIGGGSPCGLRSCAAAEAIAQPLLFGRRTAWTAALLAGRDSIVYATDLGSPVIHHVVTSIVAGLASGGVGLSQRRTLTSAPEDDPNPVWSPDASRVAFLCEGRNRFRSGNALIALSVRGS